MAVTGTHLDMPISIEDLDIENLAYFEGAAAGEFRLQKCRDCSLLRYPPGTACPFCTCPDAAWVAVEPRGAVYSYGEVHQAIQPAFRAHVPYMVLLVELDTQRGVPSEHEAIRVIGNLVTHDGELAPREVVQSVGIGSRMRMVFVPAGEGVAIPQWTLDEDAEQPEKPWRYAQE
jgi:uncharacterized OB-fold protein